MDNKDIKKTLEKISNTIAKPDGVEYVYIHQIKSHSEHDYISYVFVVPDDTKLLDDKSKLSKLMRKWQENILKYYNLYIGEHLNVIQSQTIRKGDFERLGPLRNKKKQNESIIENELNFEEDGRKTRLIQKYLDNVVVPQNKLICKAMVVRFEDKTPRDYLIRLWVNQNEPHTQEESDDLVDTTWDHIYNMFEISTAIHRVKSEC